jgi:valyl-tRNA synthetase
MTTNEFPKKYSPESFEDRIYRNWEETGLFKPQESKT